MFIFSLKNEKSNHLFPLSITKDKAKCLHSSIANSLRHFFLYSAKNKRQKDRIIHRSLCWENYHSILPKLISSSPLYLSYKIFLTRHPNTPASILQSYQMENTPHIPDLVVYFQLRKKHRNIFIKIHFIFPVHFFIKSDNSVQPAQASV